MLSLMWTECQSEYYVSNSTQSKEDFITTDLLNKKIKEGTISDFDYNEDTPSTLVYTSKNGERYYVEISDEIVLNEDNSSIDDLKDWHGCTACSEENPHIITNKYEFDSIRTHINTDENGNKYINGYFKLNNDIYFYESDFKENGYFYNDGIGFLTFGSDGSNNGYNANSLPCRLVFDGNGYCICNLVMNYSQGLQLRTGIFSKIEDGEIKNLKLNNCSMYAPTCGGLITRSLEKNGKIRNIHISNSNVEFWKEIGTMDNSGFICGNIGGELTDISIENCNYKSVTWSSGMIAGHIAEDALIRSININNCNIEQYVNSGLIANTIMNKVELKDLNISNTSVKYTHEDKNRAGILCCDGSNSNDDMMILENSNIDITYEGASESLFINGYGKIKNSKIRINTSNKSNIVAGGNIILENSNIEIYTK